eukprot:1391504-Prymnesium_polylepis.1
MPPVVKCRLPRTHRRVGYASTAQPSPSPRWREGAHPNMACATPIWRAPPQHGTRHSNMACATPTWQLEMSDAVYDGIFGDVFGRYPGGMAPLSPVHEVASPMVGASAATLQ